MDQGEGKIFVEKIVKKTTHSIIRPSAVDKEKSLEILKNTH